MNWIREDSWYPTRGLVLLQLLSVPEKILHATHVPLQLQAVTVDIELHRFVLGLLRFDFVDIVDCSQSKKIDQY